MIKVETYSLIRYILTYVRTYICTQLVEFMGCVCAPHEIVVDLIDFVFYFLVWE